MACKFKVGDRVELIEDYEHHKAGEQFIVDGFDYTEPIGCDVVDSKGNGFYVFQKRLKAVESTPTHELHITVKGRETIGVYKHDGKTDRAVAKCSPEDTFDFATGVKLVCERLGVLPTPTEPIKPTKQVHTGQYKIGDRVVVEQTICGKTDTRNGMTGIIRDIYENDDGNPYWVEFEHEYGAWCSVKCLAKEEKPTPKPYTGKMICIKSDSPWWTVGRIYNVVNGKVKADDGDTYPKGGEVYTSADDCRHMGAHETPKVNMHNEFIPVIE